MTRLIQFRGHSDDCFEIEGTRANEPVEIDCFDSAVCVEIVVQEGDDLIGLKVVGEYAPKVISVASWVFGIALLDEDRPLPEWPIYFATAANKYSPLLTIEVPDNAVVRESKA